MGTCCGKPTVWNDMCEDCNYKYDAMIFGGMGVEKPETSVLSPILDSYIFKIMLDVRDIICIHGPVTEGEEVTFCLSMSDGSDFLFLKSKMKCKEDEFMTECERIKWKFAEYRTVV